MDDKSNPLQSLGDVLRRPNTVFQSLMVRAKQFAVLQQDFLERLPIPLREHAALIQASEKNWIVRTDSANWTARLHYALHALRADFSDHLGITLPDPQVRVVPKTLPSELPPRPRPKLSDRSAIALEAAAQKVDDEKLSGALLKLAHHMRVTKTDPSNTERP